MSEDIDLNKRSELKECNIHHYWCFLDKSFKFQTYVCNWCHNLLMMSLNLDDIAILSIHGVDYCCNMNGISGSEAMKFTAKCRFD